MAFATISLYIAFNRCCMSLLQFLIFIYVMQEEPVRNSNATAVTYKWPQRCNESLQLYPYYK